MDWCLLCTFMRLDQWPREWIPVSKVSLHSVFSHKSSCLPSMHQGLSQRLLVVQAKTSNTPKSRAKMNLLSFGYGTSSKGLVQAWSLAGRSNHKELPVSWGGGFLPPLIIWWNSQKLATIAGVRGLLGWRSNVSVCLMSCFAHHDRLYTEAVNQNSLLELLLSGIYPQQWAR